MSAPPRASGLIPFLLVAWSLWLGAIAADEQVPANGGLGWDGVRFARYATDGPRALLDREINSYYVQRMGPSLAVHGTIRALGLPFDPVTIRWTFMGINLILLTGSIAMLVDLGQRLALSTHARWLLFLGLYVNAGNGRLPVYYANIGDSVAFTLGMTLLWGWISRRPWVLVLASLIALVSWPAAFYLLIPLIVWPRGEDSPDEAGVPPFDPPVPWKWGVATLPAGALLMAASWRLSEMPPVQEWSPWTTTSLATNAWLFGLAAVIALSQVTSRLRRALMTGWSTRTLLAVIVLFLSGRAYVAATESGSLAFGEGTYWREVLLYVRTRPFAPLVGHAAYFGALAVAAYVAWPRSLAVARRLGPGPFVALALMGLQALDTESRRLNANWPLICVCTVIALEPWLRDRRVMAAAGLVCLLFSKLWWRWSGPDLFAAAHAPGNYYNLQGPSMSDEAYAVHLMAAAVLLTLLGLGLRRSPAPAPGPASNLVAR
jgi:hypothetical protein